MVAQLSKSTWHQVLDYVQALQVLSAIASERIVLLAGETGCGKSTQVPQFILEDALEKGEHCRVLCAQPRRLSTVSVAQRIAAERSEVVGESVGCVTSLQQHISCSVFDCQMCMKFSVLHSGLVCLRMLAKCMHRASAVHSCCSTAVRSVCCRYRIRLERAGTKRTPVQLMTYGVLVNVLSADRELANVTHIVLDEVHEREHFADFAAILLLTSLRKHPHIKVVLMSATLEAEMFSEYFSAIGPCPLLKVPGRTFPVKQHFLEHAMAVTELPGTAEERWEAQVDGGGSKKKKKKGKTAKQAAQKEGGTGRLVDNELIDKLLRYICGEAPFRDEVRLVCAAPVVRAPHTCARATCSHARWLAVWHSALLPLDVIVLSVGMVHRTSRSW